MRGTRSILVIHPGALGDVVQAVPALRALRRQGLLTFAGQPRLGRLLAAWRLVETVLPFDGAGFEALFTPDRPPPSLVARLARFDRVVSWFGARDPVYVDQLRAIAPASVVASSVAEAGSTWRHLLSTVGDGGDADVMPLALTDSCRDEARRALAELGADPTTPLLVVHPGAGGAWKVWRAEPLARAIGAIRRRTDAQLLIHQGPADRDAVDQLRPLLDRPAFRFVEPELALLASVLGQASGYLGMDSGVSQLAAAMGAPAVILYRAAMRERWMPWSPTAQALTTSDEVGQVELVAAVTIGQMRGADRGRLERRPLS